MRVIGLARAPEVPLLVSAAIAIVAASCRQPTELDSPRLQVIAVETFLADMARNVAGDGADVEALLPPGMDPHGFEPGPSDVRKVAEADLVIANGGGLEPFLPDLVAGAGNAVHVLVASRGLSPRSAVAAGTPGGEATEQGSRRAGAEQDPHFWLDPVHAGAYVENIRSALADLDPANAPAYAANAEAYAAQLDTLHEEIAAMLAKVPEERRAIVTDHDSLGYFADRYGLRVVGTVLPGASSASQPSARDLARLTDAMRAAGVRIVFQQSGEDTRLAEQVAREAGARVVADLHVHSTTPNGPAPTYLAMVRHNAAVIADALAMDLP